MITDKQFNDLKEQVDNLEKKSIKFPMELTEKENIKNAIFNGYYQSDQTIPTVAADAPYLKVVWKNKIIYIPFYN